MYSSKLNGSHVTWILTEHATFQRGNRMFYFDRISHSLLYLTHHIRLGFILVINMFATPLESELSLSEMGSLHLSIYWNNVGRGCASSNCSQRGSAICQSPSYTAGQEFRLHTHTLALLPSWINGRMGERESICHYLWDGVWVPLGHEK